MTDHESRNMSSMAPQSTAMSTASTRAIQTECLVWSQTKAQEEPEADQESPCHAHTMPTPNRQVAITARRQHRPATMIKMSHRTATTAVMAAPSLFAKKQAKTRAKLIEVISFQHPRTYLPPPKLRISGIPASVGT